MDGARLKALRGKNRTQADVAKATGVPQQTISDYEKRKPGEGDSSRLASMYVKSLADYYGVTVRYIMGETDTPEYDTQGADGERVKQQLAEIVDALPPALHSGLVEHGRSLLRFAQEQERTQGGTGDLSPSAHAS